MVSEGTHSNGDFDIGFITSAVCFIKALYLRVSLKRSAPLPSGIWKMHICSYDNVSQNMISGADEYKGTHSNEDLDISFISQAFCSIKALYLRVSLKISAQLIVRCIFALFKAMWHIL